MHNASVGHAGAPLPPPQFHCRRTTNSVIYDESVYVYVHGFVHRYSYVCLS